MKTKVPAIVISFLIGTMFLVSAWSKLYPIEPFEYNITGTTFFGWTSSVFVARIVIGAEFAVGLLLIAAYRLKHTVLTAAAMLLVFCVHLAYVWISRGDTGDCGCMGNLMTFTPSQGLLKNAVMLLLLIPVYKWGPDYSLNRKHIITLLFPVCIAAVFILNPVDLNYASNYLNKPFEDFPLSLDTLYNATDTTKIERPVADFRSGKAVVLFVSAKCPHCKIAASKVSVIHRLNPSIPFYFFINGDPGGIRRFKEQTGTLDIPHSMLNGPVFVALAGVRLPVIYYFNRGRVEKQVDYYTLEQDYIEKWMEE